MEWSVRLSRCTSYSGPTLFAVCCIPILGHEANINEAGHNISYKIVCVPSKDLDQPAHIMLRLI